MILLKLLLLSYVLTATANLIDRPSLSIVKASITISERNM